MDAPIFVLERVLKFHHSCGHFNRFAVRSDSESHRKTRAMQQIAACRWSPGEDIADLFASRQGRASSGNADLGAIAGDFGSKILRAWQLRTQLKSREL